MTPPRKARPNMNYSEAIRYIDDRFVSFQTIGRTAYRGGLEAIAAMCRRMGDPQHRYPTLHIAGTNGKGSVAHMLAAILQAAGYRTGLYTSPHLHDFRERIRIDGVPIPEEDVCAFLERHAAAMEQEGLSYFEMTTAMAFDCFARHEVEIAVIETGLGGRLDATNIITPLLSIITNIGLDHCDLLGDTIARIAGEKAGIIKPSVPVLIGETHPESRPVFVARAAACGAPITFADTCYTCTAKEDHGTYARYTLRRLADGAEATYDLDLTGDYQQKNLATVRTAVDLLRNGSPFVPGDEALHTGLRHAAASTGLRGRWQVIGQAPLTVADGGHNPAGLTETMRQLAACRYDRLYMIVGFAADKDLEHILAMLPTEAYYFFTQADSPRALPAERLAELGARHHLHGETAPTVNDALEQARSLATPQDMIFVGGSFYLIAGIV